MNKLLAVTAGLASATLSVLLVWALWTFTAWEPNPVNWPDPARFLFFLASLIGGVATGSVTAEAVSTHLNKSSE